MKCGQYDYKQEPTQEELTFSSRLGNSCLVSEFYGLPNVVLGGRGLEIVVKGGFGMLLPLPLADLVDVGLVCPLGVNLLVFDMLAEDSLVLLRSSSSLLWWCGHGQKMRGGGWCLVFVCCLCRCCYI